MARISDISAWAMGQTSGTLQTNDFASGCVHAYHFASGAIVGVSGLIVSMNSSGQLVLSLDPEVVKIK